MQLSLRLALRRRACFCSFRSDLARRRRRPRRRHRRSRVQFSFPNQSRRRWPNGLRVIVIERAGTPLVTAQLVIKNGGEVDPPELAGLSNMVADLITKGTEKRTATQIAEAIEALGGSLYSSARWDASRVGVNVMSSKIGPAAGYSRRRRAAADVQRREIERLRQQTLDDLTVELGEPGCDRALCCGANCFWRCALRQAARRHTGIDRANQPQRYC